MRVLVTGGCGFVGRHFAKRLVADKHDVMLVDDLSSGIAPLDWIEMGALDFEQRDVRKWFKSATSDEFDLVIHCAAIVGGRLKIDGDPLAVATDLAIDSMFFDWVVRAKKKPKVVYFSSSAVYPLRHQTKEFHCELYEGLVNFLGQSVDLPDQTYGWVKLNGEYLAKFAAEHYGLDVAIYRPFGGYGEDQSFDYPFPSIIRRIVGGENPVTVWGSGDQRRDFIHIDDIVNGVLSTMYDLCPAEPLNLGTGTGYSFRELARIASDVLKIPVDIVNDASKPEGVFSRVAGVTKLKRFGWKPRVTLEEGIRRVAAALTTRSV